MSGSRPGFIAEPGGRVSGEIRVPGDKSISHRAAMLGAIAQGSTDIHGFLNGEDCHATLAAIESMGISIERPAHDRIVIEVANSVAPWKLFRYVCRTVSVSPTVK